MKYIADFHIHSHFSIATSKNLIPSILDLWARKKGVAVIGTGDAVHPGWFDELQANLVQANSGLYQLKKGKEHPESKKYSQDIVSFIPTAEISCIYKKNNKVRKVHNLIVAPDFTSIDKIKKTLARTGSIASDGRPILKLDSRDLLEIVLNADANLIPAHIWTPWFSVLGSKSGFDCLEECYGDLTKYIFSVETGLSSDPPMNWKCSFLDRYTLVSNSDAHSPEKLGREANLFDTELTYDAMIDALKGRSNGLLGTVEFFPQEGKYFLDGHQKCGICWEPHQTREHNNICPVCGKKVTVGVLNRVCELADKEAVKPFKNQRPYWSLTSLKSILAEINNVGSKSKMVSVEYESLLSLYGSEFAILMEISPDVFHQTHPQLEYAIRRLRAGTISIDSGFDGKFGNVRVMG